MTEKDFEDNLKNLEGKQAKYDRYFLNRCSEAAGMSYCSKLRVGSVAVRDNRTILDGWNGAISGQSNCCEETCEKCQGSGSIDVPHGMIDCPQCSGFGIKTKPTIIHAERNIIFYAARKGISLEGATMYISHAPCVGCVQAMAAAGIVRVVYAESYRNEDGINFLNKLKIKVEKVTL